MALFRAEYKHPASGQVDELEFEHEFMDHLMIISEAKNLTRNYTMQNVYIGYLIYNSIREVQPA
jgi:hypothetical protein